jgi:hypothetical protein
MAKSTEWIKKVESQVEKLANEVDAVKASEIYRKHLDTMSKFWHYSLHNQLLIAIQFPTALRVAGYNKWKEMGRWVKAGETAIRILAPGLKKVEEEEGEEKTIQYFFPVCVFDISQTEGKPLDIMDCHIDGEGARMYLDSLASWCEENGIAIKLESLGYGHYGSSRNGSVVVNEDDNVNTQFATLVHELSHEFLHWTKEDGEKCSHQRVEAEAEGAAYVVLIHFGIETKAPEYLAIHTKDRKVLQESLGNISEAAKRIIAAVESKLAVEEEVAA